MTLVQTKRSPTNNDKGVRILVGFELFCNGTILMFNAVLVLIINDCNVFVIHHYPTMIKHLVLTYPIRYESRVEF